MLILVIYQIINDFLSKLTVKFLLKISIIASKRRDFHRLSGRAGWASYLKSCQFRCLVSTILVIFVKFLDFIFIFSSITSNFRWIIRHGALKLPTVYVGLFELLLQSWSYSKILRTNPLIYPASESLDAPHLVDFTLSQREGGNL